MLHSSLSFQGWCESEATLLLINSYYFQSLDEHYNTPYLQYIFYNAPCKNFAPNHRFWDDKIFFSHDPPALVCY